MCLQQVVVKFTHRIKARGFFFFLYFLNYFSLLLCCFCRVFVKQPYGIIIIIKKNTAPRVFIIFRIYLHFYDGSLPKLRDISAEKMIINLPPRIHVQYSHVCAIVFYNIKSSFQTSKLDQ